VVQRCADIALVPADDMAGLGTTPLQPRGEPTALREVAAYDADFDRRWTIGSFSALVRTLPAASPLPGVLASSVAAVRNDEPGDAVAGDTVASPSRATVATIDAPWHRFPRGAFAGNFLHDQLEWLATEGFDLAASPERQQQLLRRCERQGWAERAPDVLAWLLRVLQSALPPVGASLDALAFTVPEMEFWLPAQTLGATQIDTLCRQHLLGGRDRPLLPERELHGMLMGFADIVFEHGGRYWVLDHKSNHLGGSDADYDHDALEGAMAAHRYDVQSTIYLLALHRLLRSRLGAAYDPAMQLGGAVFLFLRGIDGPDHGCYHVPPVLPLLDALDRLLGATAEVDA
jgi:exodeoxyribonuclease V beta subunit